MPEEPHIEQEWDDLFDLLDEHGCRYGQDHIFLPTRARAFASELALATSPDEARACIERDRVGAAHFSVAAHFAVAFVRCGTPAVATRDSTQTEPFLLVASAVLNLLDTLSDRYPSMPS